MNVTTVNAEWKLASWRGSSGQVRVALTETELKNAKLVVSTTDKIGPKGTFTITKVINSSKATWQAEREMMNGVNIHYRHYLKENVDRELAAVYMHRSLEYWLAKKAHKEIARVAYELASVYKGLSQIDKAYKLYENAKNNWLEIGNLNAAATAANVMGLINRSKGEYDIAISNFDDAYQWRISLARLKLASISLNNLALIYLDRGDFSNAIHFFKKALDDYGWIDEVNLKLEELDGKEFIFRVAAIGDVRRATSMFSNLALAYDKKGKHLQAINLWKKSLLLSQNISDQAKIGIIQNNIGRAYFDRGMLKKAHDYLSKSHTLLENYHDKKFLALVNYNLADLYFLIGKYDDALDFYESSKKLRESYGDLKGVNDSLLALGKVYKSLRNFKRSSDYLYQAEIGYKQLNLKGKHGIVLYELAGLFYENNKSETALKLVNKSLGILISNGTKRELSRGYLLLADIELSLNKIKVSIKNYEIAKAIAVINNDQLLIPNILSKISINQEKLNKFELALINAEKAVKKYDELNDQFQLSSDKAKFTESYYSAVIHLSQLMLHDKNIENALLTFDQIKSKTFGQWSYQFTDNDYYESKLREIGKLQEQQESIQDTDENALNIIKTKTREMYRDLQKLTETSSQIYIPLSQIPKLKEGTVVIQYMLSNPSSIAFVIDSEGVKSFTLASKSDIDDNVQNIHLSIKSQNRNLWLKSIHYLEDMLIPKSINLDKYSNLIIVADGALQSMPFAGLKNNGKLIIDQVELSFAPSLSVYTLLNQNEQDTPLDITVYADPIYQKIDIRYIDSTSQQLTMNTKSFHGSLKRGKNLKRLNGAENEAQIIKELMGGTVKLKTGYYANRADIISSPNDSSILHFATHSTPNEKMSGLSAIELSRFDESGNKVNSSLRAIDISRLKHIINPKLVVLSACETSLGQYVRGEGYLGLTRAFLEIGTQNVVSTLWEIDDNTTADLMKVFYQGLLNGKTVTASLQLAQNSVRKTKPNPYYWAGFVSHGSTKLRFK